MQAGLQKARICTLCFFFFQAEDGIRDLTVTGVQTCALPISVGQVGTDRCDRPVAIADLFRLGQEVGQPAGVELLLAFAAPRQPSLALRLEATGQRAEELERRGL